MDLFSHLRGVVRRHEHLADATIAAAVFGATMVSTFAGHTTPSGGDRATALVAAALGCGVLAIRRARPLTTLAVSALGAEVFLYRTGSANGVLVLLAPCIALYTVAELVERRRGLLIGGAVVAVLALAHILMRPGMLGPQNLALSALGGLAIAAGDSSRNRRAYLAEATARAERAELEREEDARRRVAEERLRIARDLHDSVGHHLALISVQSDVAGRAVEGDAAAARAALSHVKSASRKALEELRDTVSLLRQPGDPVAPVTIPAPGLDALEDLLGSLRDSGLAVDVLVKGTAAPLAPAADVSAYRVIQESLTNVYKHSRGRHARLTLGYDRHELLITVDDLGGTETGGGRGPGHAPRPALGRDWADGGHGIPGMRERVLALGGRFSAGPRGGGAFRVTAALPYQPLEHQPLEPGREGLA
jgi:signal transduction histidine kinase